jgi:hypothetical protein
VQSSMPIVSELLRQLIVYAMRVDGGRNRCYMSKFMIPAAASFCSASISISYSLQSRFVAVDFPPLLFNVSKLVSKSTTFLRTSYVKLVEWEDGRYNNP